MIKYVIAFLFTPDLSKVWMIEKQKPHWQKGKLNGIGGKLEPGETPIKAMVREIREESGIEADAKMFLMAGVIEGIDDENNPYEVTIYTGTTDQTLVSKEAEVIGLYDTRDFNFGDYSNRQYLENVPMLIHTCIYALMHESNFTKAVFHYKGEV